MHVGETAPLFACKPSHENAGLPLLRRFSRMSSQGQNPFSDACKPPTSALGRAWAYGDRRWPPLPPPAVAGMAQDERARGAVAVTDSC